MALIVDLQEINCRSSLLIIAIKKKKKLKSICFLLASCFEFIDDLITHFE